MFFAAQAQQQATLAHQETQAENAARLAFSRHRIETRGATSRRMPDPIAFEVGFTEPPTVMTGVAIVDDPDSDLGWVPDVTAGVYQWDRNVKGQYTGAFIFVSVSSRVGAMQAVVLEHHFTFSGVAYKEVSAEAATDAQLLSPRPVGYGGVH